MSQRGKFIVFEGTDGSGKSTQMKLLAKHLSEAGVNVYCTREPTDSQFGTLLRACMTGKVETDERAIALLFAADRIDHIQNPVTGMLKKLDEGVTVLCDRFYFSSFAYNGNFVSPDWVIELNRPAMELLRPDLVIFLDLDPEEGMRRIAHRGDKERYETLERQRSIRNRYLHVFEMFPKMHVEKIRSEEDKTETQEKIRAAVDPLFE